MELHNTNITLGVINVECCYTAPTSTTEAINVQHFLNFNIRCYYCTMFSTIRIAYVEIIIANFQLTNK